MPQNNFVFLRCHKKKQASAGNAVPGTTKAVNRPLKLYLLPEPKTHPRLVISFKEPTGQGHLFLVFAPSTCTTKPIKALSEIFLAPANKFLLIKQSKGPGGYQKRNRKIF